MDTVDMAARYALVYDSVPLLDSAGEDTGHRIPAWTVPDLADDNGPCFTTDVISEDVDNAQLWAVRQINERTGLGVRGWSLVGDVLHVPELFRRTVVIVLHLADGEQLEHRPHSVAAALALQTTLADGVGTIRVSPSHVDGDTTTTRCVPCRSVVFYDVIETVVDLP